RFKSNINVYLEKYLPIIKKDSVYKKSFIKSVLFMTTEQWETISIPINTKEILFKPISKSQCIPKP
ncbi:DNA-binding protein, partial [Brachyspira intermedia]